MGEEGSAHGVFVGADGKRGAVIVGVKAEEVKEVRNLALEGVVLALKRANRINGIAGSRVAGASVGGGGGKRAGASTVGAISLAVVVSLSRIYFRSPYSVSSAE